ncbi:MAG: glycosyltransferase family 87 protein [Microthrixaceae bacterium]
MTNRRLINAISGAVLALVLCLAAAGALFGPQPGEEDYRLGLDFPAFYGAGQIAADGELDHLYETDVQEAAQAGLLDDGLMYFAYPQPVALAYAPLTALAPVPAYLLHTALMMGALVAAVALLRPMVRWIDEWPLPATALALLFVPMASAVTLGQNTALSLLLVVAAWRLLRADRDVEAGVALALACYKPQIGIPLVGLVLLSRRYRVLGGAAATGAGVYLATALAAGWDWPWHWWEWANWYNSIETTAGAKHLVSFSGAAMVAFGSHSAAATVVGGALTLATGIALAYLWWARRFDLDTRMALTLIGIVLASTHAVSHDAALALPGVALLVDRLGEERRWVPIGIFAMMVVQGLSGEMGFSVAPLALVATAAMLVRTAPASRSTRPISPAHPSTRPKRIDASVPVG